jgi:hypothetical protein
MNGAFRVGNRVTVFDKTSVFYDKSGTIVACVRPGIYSVKLDGDSDDGSLESIIWIMAYQVASAR